MFTGLVREIGVLQAVTRSGGAVCLAIRAAQTAAELKVGDSVAVDGVCLTVTHCRGPVFSVEAVGETQRLTTAGRWRSGRRVHLEPALRLGDALDGHLMQGHVDGVGRITRLHRQAGAVAMTIAAAPAQLQYLTPKGSVAVDGVSLTVDEGPFRQNFTVHLIGHTVSATHFAAARVGDQVNLEMDALVKAVWARQEAGRSSERRASESRTPRSRTMAELLAQGFGRSHRRK